MASTLTDMEKNSKIQESELKNASSKDNCSNCGSPLIGKFCHSCGQPSRSIIKFFGNVLAELLDDVFGYDSRLKHTIFPLLFKPGQITSDYISGKIYHYILPIRLYLILSVVCLVMVQAITDPKKIVNEDVTITMGSDSDPNVVYELENARKSVLKSDVVTDLSGNSQGNESRLGTPGSRYRTAITSTEDGEVEGTVEFSNLNKPKTLSDENSTSNGNLESVSTKVSAITNSTDNSTQITLSGDYFDVSIDEKTDEFKFRGDFYKDYPQAKSVVMEIYDKSKEWKDDPTPLVNQIFELFPIMMLFILPLFAIVLKVFYVFKKRYYVEHLVFCLHNHSFIYFAVIFDVFLNLLEDYLLDQDHWLAQFLSQLTAYASIALACWVMVYIGLSLKRVYRQSWLVTLSKMTALGVIYFLFLFVGLMATTLIGAWQA
jgi:hypothetical protein